MGESKEYTEKDFKEDLEELEEMEMSDLVHTFTDQNSFHFEGESGVRSLESLLNAITYDNVQDFLVDNPGAIESIIDWISNQSDIDEWKELLRETLAQNLKKKLKS